MSGFEAAIGVLVPYWIAESTAYGNKEKAHAYQAAIRVLEAAGKVDKGAAIHAEIEWPMDAYQALGELDEVSKNDKRLNKCSRAIHALLAALPDKSNTPSGSTGRPEHTPDEG